MKEIHILHLEDNPVDAKLIKAILDKANITCKIQVIMTKTELEKALQDESLDLIFSDYTLPSFDGLTALKIAKQKRPEIPFLLISGVLGEERIIEIFQAGANDLILKQHLERLIPATSMALAQLEEHKKLKIAEKALRESESHYHALATLSPVGIFKMDANAKSLLYVNERISEILGFNAASLLGENWPQVIHPDDREIVLETVTQTIKNCSLYQKEFRICRPNGIDIWVMCQAAPEKNEQEQTTSFVGTLTDITELKKIQHKLQKLARFDPLTNLPNRLLFEETLERSILHMKRINGKLALFFIDLDFFKKVNSTVGFSNGDLLLKEVAVLLQKNIRTHDFIARLGDDEFAIIVEDYDNISNLLGRAQRMVNDFKKPFHIEHHEIISTASVGIAIYPEAGTDHIALIQHADQALYQAKTEGRNNYKFYAEGMQQQIERYVALEKNLHHAIEKNELELYYQPQIDLETNKVVGIEALLRWQNPELGEVTPLEFIPIAENTGLIREIGAWVIDTGLAQYHEWSKTIFSDKPRINISINISMNLSPFQLIEQNIIGLIKDGIKKFNINPANVVFELTETALMKKLSETKAILDILSALGIGIAIDDFGVGYASLTYLRLLPIKTLKIDKSFVQGIGNDINSEAIIRAILELSKSLELKVIAEGVETQPQINFLKKYKCQLIQGFYFSKALSTNDLEAYVKKNT